MTTISISDQRLTIKPSRFARWFGSPVDVPLAHVVSAVVAESHEMNGRYRGIRLAGIQVPGLITAGLFREGGRLMWWDVRRGENVIAITLRDERVSRLFVEIENPASVARLLDQAIAGAVLPSDASVR